MSSVTGQAADTVREEEQACARRVRALQRAETALLCRIVCLVQHLEAMQSEADEENNVRSSAAARSPMQTLRGNTVDTHAPGKDTSTSNKDMSVPWLRKYSAAGRLPSAGLSHKSRVLYELLGARNTTSRHDKDEFDAEQSVCVPETSKVQTITPTANAPVVVHVPPTTSSLPVHVESAATQHSSGSKNTASTAIDILSTIAPLPSESTRQHRSRLHRTNDAHSCNTTTRRGLRRACQSRSDMTESEDGAAVMEEDAEVMPSRMRRRTEEQTTTPDVLPAMGRDVAWAVSEDEVEASHSPPRCTPAQYWDISFPSLHSPT